jgi:superfamily II DNA or RNA helicase
MRQHKKRRSATRPRRPSPSSKVKPAAPKIVGPDLEFHRHGVAWLWGGGTAFVVRHERTYGTSCSCRRSRKDRCEHVQQLSQWDERFRERTGGQGPGDVFRESVWYRLAAALADANAPALRETALTGHAADQPVLVIARDDAVWATCVSAGLDRVRFIGRCGAARERAGPRGAVLDSLASMTLTEDERTFAASGLPSRRQVLEASLAYRLAYHGFREFGAAGALFAEAVDENSGTFWLTALEQDFTPALRLAIPPIRVEAVRQLTAALTIPGGRLPTLEGPVPARYRVEPSDDHGLQVRLLVVAPTPAGQGWPRVAGPRDGAGATAGSVQGKPRLLDPARGGVHRFGGLVYLTDPGVFAPLWEPEPLGRRLQGGVVTTIQRRDVPKFLVEVGDAPYLVDASDDTLQLHRSVAELNLFAHALEQDWCWISVTYGAGNSTLSLATLRQAREEGRAFVEVADGWLDCAAAGLEGLEALGEGEATRPDGAVRVSRAELLRLTRRGTATVTVNGAAGPAETLRHLVELTPAAPLPELRGLRSVLRPYQRRGAEWLVFLAENRLGGLLCDDMGLGKTHQVMALMVYLRERAGVEAPFLVVCPATVLSHWAAKLRDYAPELPQLLHHGGERDLDQVVAARGVVLTSYGVLRNDYPILAEAPFFLAVFDEAQNIKNTATRAHLAARSLGSNMKLAVTGTPIENSVLDLKALLDLVAPGYLGADREFAARYVEPGGTAANRGRREELARLVSPFTLRRLKAAVLDELPDKIEDLRTCRLSEEQVRLYRDAVGERSGALLEALGRTGQAVPYLHVFALLSTLKQICDHPALLHPRVEGYEAFASGKWELFAELLSESLESGQKVVVFTHFLGMIEIMERHLRSQGVGFATLTGRSRNRGKLIERFQQDPDCRVFLASLKAGGAGIDLVAGSVVIHYDRWWNAAAEDQATDRVHRIGQTRGVQVFKLITEGTLEEKIAAIIERKRALLRDVVTEDDPGMLKVFTREELVAMLAPPE